MRPSAMPRSKSSFDRYRLAVRVVLLALVLAVIATVSRGMMLGLAIGLVAALYLRRPVRGLSLSLFALMVGAVFAGLILAPPGAPFEQHVEGGEEQKRAARDPERGH